MQQIHQQIQELREQGQSLDEIQQILGCSSHTVSSALASTRTISQQGQKILQLRQSGFTFSEILKQTGYSKSSISKWIKLAPKLVKPPKPEPPPINNKNPLAISRRASRTDKRAAINRWFKEIKTHCSICGYNKTDKAIDFHHTKDKNFQLSRCDYKSLEAIIAEIQKCVLLCKNCHTEHHENQLDISHLQPIQSIQPPEYIIKAFTTRTPTILSQEILEFEKSWISSKTQPKPPPQPREDKEINFKEVKIVRISKEKAAELLNKYHYLGMSGKGGWYYGIEHHNEIIGCAIITNAVRQGSENYCEISRFVLTVNTPNLGSKFISLLVQELKKTKYKGVQAYADQSIHTGGLYKAANFKHTSTSKPTINYNGIHKKTIYERAKSLGLTENEYALIFNLTAIPEAGKQKYTYEFDR